MKLHLLFIGLIFFGKLFSQNDLISISPLWKLNEVRKVHSEATMKVYINDTLSSDTKAVNSYTIKVIDTTKNYLLSYSQKAGDLDLSLSFNNTKADSVAQKLTKIIKMIEVRLTNFQYQIVLDKQSGQAIEIKNRQELNDSLTIIIKSIVYELGTKKGKSQEQMDSMATKILRNFKAKEASMIETTLNQVNVIFQAYSYSFPLKGSYSQELMIHDVNAGGYFGASEFPATMVIQSVKNSNNTLKVNTNLLYDKKFLLEQIKKKSTAMNDLKEEDLSISEKNDILFDLKNTWIISHKSNVEFLTPKVKVYNETTMTFSK